MWGYIRYGSYIMILFYVRYYPKLHVLLGILGLGLENVRKWYNFYILGYKRDSKKSQYRHKKWIDRNIT